jgi:archaellum component FlaD/FlaE
VDKLSETQHQTTNNEQRTRNKKQRTTKENKEQKTTNNEHRRRTKNKKQQTTNNNMHFALIGAAGYIAHLKAIKETGNTLVAAPDEI